MTRTGLLLVISVLLCMGIVHGANLIVEESDGSPRIQGTTRLKLSGATLTNQNNGVGLIAFNTYNGSTFNGDFAEKAATIVFTAGNGLTGGGDISASRTFTVATNGSLLVTNDKVQLNGDVASPGNSKYYGTNGSGVKGWNTSVSGTVTSVSVNNGDLGLNDPSGSPITASGTITLTTNGNLLGWAAKARPTTLVVGNGDTQTLTNKTFVAPVLGAATATSINSTTIPSSKTLVVTTDKISVLAATTSAELAGVLSDEVGSSGGFMRNGVPLMSSATLNKTTTLNGNTISVPPLTQGDLLFSKIAGSLTRLAKGTDHYVLKTNGNRLAWEAAAAGGSGSPGGASKQIQFNRAGSFDGNGRLLYDYDNDSFELDGVAFTQQGDQPFNVSGDMSIDMVTTEYVNIEPDSGFTVNAGDNISITTGADMTFSGSAVEIQADTLYLASAEITTDGKILAFANVNGTNLTASGTVKGNRYNLNGNTLSIPSLGQGSILFSKVPGALAVLDNGASSNHKALKVNGNTLAWESIAAGGGSGTVTSVSNGDVYLSIANKTTTPVITMNGALASWAGKARPTTLVVGNGDTQTLTNKTLTSPTLTTPSAFTTGGVITLAENTSVALDPAGSADGKYSGITIAGTAGATLAFGDLVYLAVADSRWELTDADSATTAGGVLTGICVLAAAADGSATTILLKGTIRADANFPALTIGAPVYASTTAGDIQVAQPSGTDDVIHTLGFALTADEIYFSPSVDYMTHI